MRRRHEPAGNNGFTLVELVVVIAVAGIVAAMVSVVILRPVQGYDAQVRRAELVDAAESALRRIARDIRAALPNSVRVDPTGQVIEMLNTIDGARYREGPGELPGGHDHSPSQHILRFPGVDNDGFNIVGTFNNITVPFNSGANHRLAIYHLGVPNADAYADAAAAGGPVVMTNPAVTRFSIDDDGGGDEHQVLPTLGNFHFRWRSPSQRVYIVDGPVTYHCDAAGVRNVLRYVGYAIQAAQPTDRGAAPLANVTPALVTNRVSGCTFTYQAGTSERAGVVTLDMSVNDPDTGEQVRLLHQVHVDNVP